MSLYGNKDKSQDSEIAVLKRAIDALEATVTLLVLNKLDVDGENGGLPTSDPTVAGALWSNSNVVNVSTGS